MTPETKMTKVPFDPTAQTSRARFAWAGTALFLIFGLIRLWLHEPWRDECNVWVLGLDCGSLEQLLRYIRTEGHTYYVYLLAWMLAQFFETFFVMQTLHLVAATLGGFLLLRYAPWPKWETALCLCGYFLAYEYTIPCRPYVAAVIGVLMIAIAWGKRADRSWLGGAGAFVLTQSSVFGVILVLAVIPALGVVGWQRRRDKTLTAAWCTGWLAPIAVGAMLSVLMLVPPKNEDPTNDWHLRFNPQRACELGTRLWHVFAPLPNANSPFPWNSNVVEPLGVRTGALLGVLTTGLTLWLLRREPVPFLIVITSIAGVCSFCYLKYFGWPRHHGHVFLALLLALWIVAAGRAAAASTGIDRFRRVLFAVQAVAGIWMSVYDCAAPFSANREAAQFIAAANFGEHLIVSHSAPAVSGVAMYLRRPIYHLNRAHNRWGSFLVWDRNEYRCRLEKSTDVFRSAADFGDEQEKPVLLVLTWGGEPTEGFRRVASFHNSMIWDETFDLYARQPFAARHFRSEEFEQLTDSPDEQARRQ